MFVDAHNHLGKRVDLAQTHDQLIRRMEAEGMDKCVVFAFPKAWDNDYVYEAVKKYPDRLIGFCGVNAWDDRSTDIIKKCVEKYGFKGIKLHPLRDGYALDKHKITDPIFSLAEHYGIPIISHGCDEVFNSPYLFEEMARTFTKVKLIMAHGGFLWAREQGVRVASRNDNIYVETSIMYADDVHKFVSAIGDERVIWGTDSPVSYFDIERRKIEMAVKDNESRRKIMGENILRLLNLTQ